MSVNNYAQEKFYAWEVNAGIDDLPLPVQESEISYVSYLSMVGNSLLKEKWNCLQNFPNEQCIYIKYRLLFNGFVFLVPYSQIIHNAFTTFVW